MKELPKLPDLPSLDEFDEKPAKESSPSLSLPELPDLPPLDDSQEFEDGFEEHEEITDEAIEEDFVQVEDDFEEDFEEDFEDYYDHYDEQLLSFLPPVNVDEVDLSDEDIDELEKQIDDENPNGKELDDEAVKEFFVNLKNKIFKPKSKSAKQTSKSKLSISKVLKPLLGLIPLIAIIFGAIFILGRGFTTLDELTIEAKQDETSIILSDFVSDEEALNVKITNDSDSSIELFLDLKLVEQSLNPFNSNEVECMSDFIGLEVNEESTLSFNCKVNPNAKYKAKVDITNTY